MRIALIGADGQLGSDLLEVLKKKDLFPLYYPEFDVTDKERMKQKLEFIKPDTIINTSAFNNVDAGEERIKEAFEVNTFAVRDLSFISLRLGAALMHFSSDYVFDGLKKSPYHEADKPNPLNVYGVSKLTGEYFIQNILEKYYIIRTSGLYGEAGCKGKDYNFVDLMVQKAEKDEDTRIIDDQYTSPTWTFELAERIRDLLNGGKYGLYHMSSEGECTWFQFADKIFSLLGKRPPVTPVDAKSYGARAKRPLYSVLENRALKEIGIRDFSNWEGALKRYMKKKGYI